MPREIIVEWTTASGAGKKSVLFFDTGTTAASQRTALSTMLTSIQTSLVSGNTWRIANVGRELDNSTGTLTGAWSDASVKSGGGTVPPQQVADATQVLFQWRTGVIVNGRFLRGRTFIPGLAVSNLSGGNLLAGVQTGFQGYGTTFLNANVGFQVWHRPVNGSGGQVALGGTCTVWSELAVLRRRRG